MEEEQKVNDLEANIGRIEIDYKYMLDLQAEVVKKVMGELIVIDTEHGFITNKITYTAFSDKFDKIANGGTIPFYDIVVDQKDEEEIKVGFERRD